MERAVLTTAESDNPWGKNRKPDLRSGKSKGEGLRGESVAGENLEHSRNLLCQRKGATTAPSREVRLAGKAKQTAERESVPRGSVYNGEFDPGSG